MFYLLHEIGTEPIFDNMNYIIKDEHRQTPHNYIIHGIKYCKHQKIEIIENSLNPERINICFNNIEYTFNVMDYHDEKTFITFYRKIDSK